MDIELDIRRKFIERYNEHFNIFEEVKVRSIIWQRNLIVDLLIQPKGDFSELCFAIEVKNKDYWKRSSVAAACKQASDYIYCVTEQFEVPRVINSAFVYFPYENEIEREHEEILGVFDLAAKHKVGTISERVNGDNSLRSKMKMFNDLWYSDTGFNKHATGIFTGKRRFGSQKIPWKIFENRILNLYES